MKQISVFLENRKGSLEEVTSLLKDLGINIESFSLADTESFGLLRMVVDNPSQALEGFKEAGIAANVSEVTVVNIPDKAGALHDLIGVIGEFPVEYLYMYSNIKGQSGVVLKLDEKEEAEKLIIDAGYSLRK